VKTILEAMILKHHLEAMLGVKHTSTSSEEDAPHSDCSATWVPKPADTALFQDLEAALDGAKRPGLARRRSTPRV